MPGTDSVGVVLLQMGGPGSPEELGPFLRNLFSDPEMIRLPWWLRALQPILGRAYGTYRVREVRDEYEAIGWSKLTPTTASLAGKVQARLDGRVAGVRVAMRYTPPRARSAVRALAQEGVDRFVGLTLYPFYSYATTGSSIKDLEAAVDTEAPASEVETIERWGSEPGFIETQAEWTRRTIEARDRDELGEVAVLLSTHGIPQAYVDEGDPYPEEVRDAAGRFEDALEGVDRVELGFQSDVGPVEWTRPYVPDVIDEIAADGVDTLVVVPFGFVSEHIETEYEIDVDYRNHALDAGIDEVLRVPAFDDDPRFADLLADIVQEHLEGAA